MKREELIERAKMALYGVYVERCKRIGPSVAPISGYDADPLFVQAMTEQAEAALTAILEGLKDPSDEMISAGIIERHDQPCPEAWNLATRNIFVAMLSTLDDRSTGGS